MWPFGKKRTPPSSPAEEEQRKPLVFDEIIPGRNYVGEGFDPDDLVQLRVWLPEPLKEALWRISEYQYENVSEYVRDFLAIHLYGVHEVIRMEKDGTGIHYDPMYAEGLRKYSLERTREHIPHLGKNIYGLKLYLQKQVKQDLQDAAESFAIPLSRYVRHLLVSHVFGHNFWPHPLPSWMIQKDDAADAWEQDPEQYSE